MRTEVTELTFGVCRRWRRIIVGAVCWSAGHSLYIVACETPIAPGVKISKDEPVGEPQLNLRHSVRYLTVTKSMPRRGLSWLYKCRNMKQPSLLTVNGSIQWPKPSLRHRYEVEMESILSAALLRPGRRPAAGGLSEEYSGVNSMNGIEQLYDH